MTAARGVEPEINLIEKKEKTTHELDVIIERDANTAFRTIGEICLMGNMFPLSTAAEEKRLCDFRTYCLHFQLLLSRVA
jgi:hypothetical protein